MKTDRHRPSARGGFSLVELLVVLAIMGLLLGLAVPALQSILQNTAITQGGQTLAQEVNMARQLASSRNTTVQVRLIQLVQKKNEATPPGYNAIQLWGVPSGGDEAVALSRMEILPATVVVSQDTENYSRLLDPSNGTSLISSKMTIAAGQANYVAFSVTPSGSIPSHAADTGGANQMIGTYLSVVPSRFGSASAAPGSDGAPRNYVTLQINPSTSSTLVYRP